MAAAPSETQAPPRFDDWFERLDARIFRLETGVIAFALCAMSLTYFLKIVFEAVIAQRNFVDSFLLRWVHTGAGPAPAELVDLVHGVWTPSLVGTGVVLMSFAAARTMQIRGAQLAHGGAHVHDTAQRQGPHNHPPRLPWTWQVLAGGAAIAAGLVVFGWLVTVVPARLACVLLYVGGLWLFARRALRRGELALWLVTWAVLSVPVGMLLWRIPEQYAWVNDLSKVLIMYVGFVGASMASRERRHVALNFGRKLWPKRWERGIEVVSIAGSLAFVLLLAALAMDLLLMRLHSDSQLSILPLPEYHIVLPVVVSFLLMAMRLSADLLRLLRRATPVPAHVTGAAAAVATDSAAAPAEGGRA